MTCLSIGKVCEFEPRINEESRTSALIEDACYSPGIPVPAVMQESLDASMDFLLDYLPPYTLFHTSTEGVWVAPDKGQIEMDNIPTSDATPDQPHPDTLYPLVISDHGNMTLYHWEGDGWKEVWGCV